MIADLLTEACTIQVRSGTANSYGDTILGASGAPVNAVGYLEQQTTIENLVDRDTTVTKWVGYLPASTSISRFDYITFQSKTFEVSGEPENCYNPRTQVVSHIRLHLTVVS